MKSGKTHHTIYSDWDMLDLINDESYWEDVKYGYMMDDEEFEMLDKFQFVADMAQENYEAERCNLDIDVGNTIIAIADLGLWDGRRRGYKEIKSGNISACLYSECEYNEWWCDAHDLRGKMAHHDGTNYILYRRRKDGISDYQWDNFLYKLYTGTANREHISKYTTSLLPYVAEVYGWKYRKNNRKVA
jgi:hypothetical protein